MHVVGATVLVFAVQTPAHAQFYEYQPRDPSVEVHMDELGGTQEQPPQAMPAPVTSVPLLPPPPVTLAPPPAPTPRVEVPPQPSPKRLLKPFFTVPAPKEKPHAAETGPVAKPSQKPMVLPGPEERKPGIPPPRAAPPEIPSEWQDKSSAAEPAPAADAAADLTIAFTGNVSEAGPDVRGKLGPVLARLNAEADTRLQVRAYAAGEDGNKGSARRISLARALSVRSYLMDHGIKPNRIDVRALGAETAKTPVDRVDVAFVK